MIAGLAVIAACAFSMRACNLSEQSMWIDEVLAQPLDDSLTLSEHLAHIRHRGPDNLPLYHVLLYALFRLGTNAIQQRLLGISLGTATCLVLGLLGWRVFGAWAGLWAALLYALSPYYAYMDQALRPYPLVTLLAALSLATVCLYAERERAQWLAANTACNALMLAVHLTSAFLLVAVGLFLLLFVRRRFWHVAAWGAVNIALAAAAYSLTIIPPPEALYTSPTPLTFLADLVADDFMWFNPALLPSLSGPVAPLVGSLYAGTLFRVHAIAAAGVLLASVLCGIAAGREARTPGVSIRHVTWLFASVAVVPLLCVTALSFLKEPMHLPRYTIFSSLALYILSGFFLTRIPRLARTALAILLISAYLVQAAWFVTTDLRTQSLRVAELLSDRHQPGDPVMLTRYPDTFMNAQWTVLEFTSNLALRDMALPICHFYNFERAAGRAAETLVDRQTAPGGKAWFVVYCEYDTNPITACERALERHGFTFVRHKFDAMSGILVYEALLQTFRSPEPPGISYARAAAFDALLDHLSVHIENGEARRAAYETLDSVFNDNPAADWNPVARAAFSFLLGESDPALALAVADAVVAEDDQLAIGWVARGAALFQLGRKEEAADNFRHCLEARPGYYPHSLKPLFEALAKQDYERARALAQRAVRAGSLMPVGLLRALGVQPRSNPC